MPRTAIAGTRDPRLLVVVLRGGRTVAEFPGGADEGAVLAAAEKSEEERV